MSEELVEFITNMVRAVNKKGNMKTYRERYSPGENRTLLFIVEGGREGMDSL